MKPRMINYPQIAQMTQIFLKNELWVFDLRL